MKEIISQAHAAGLKVNLCADAPARRRGRQGGVPRSCRPGHRRGRDTVVVGALPTARWIADTHPGVPLVAGAPSG